MHNDNINSQEILNLDLAIPSSELVFGQQLGFISYGRMYKGEWKDTNVAIKEIDFDGQISEQVFDEFKKEVLIMAQLGLQCPQLVRLIGVCFEQPYSKLSIVTELLMRGSLYRLLRDSSSILEPDWLKWKESISIARDVAIGLKFLHENGVIHQDVKSFHVLLDQHLSAKLSDYGLAAIKQANGVRPVQEESSSENEPPYSFARDIFRYGKVLLEMAMHLELKRGLTPKTPYHIPQNTPIYFSRLIEDCLTSNPADRPSATHIIEKLTRPWETAPTTPVYPRTQGDFLLFSIKALPQRPATSPLESYIIGTKTQQELAKFLHHVGYGEQDEAEKMLRAQPQLATFSGHLTDCASRDFEQITGFQYAIWALDYHMWTMIKKYLPIPQARDQVAGLNVGKWINTHGAHISWNQLITLLGTYYKENYGNFRLNWNWHKFNNFWCQEVGSAQLRLPAHVINEYSHPSRSFSPCPQWNGLDEVTLPRTGVMDWITTGDGGELGHTFAWVRATLELRSGIDPYHLYKQRLCPVENPNELLRIDHNACAELLKSRMEQAQALICELTARPVVPQLRL